MHSEQQKLASHANSYKLPCTQQCQHQAGGFKLSLWQTCLPLTLLLLHSDTVGSIGSTRSIETTTLVATSLCLKTSVTTYHLTGTPTY